jgi:hypothetical protein
VPPQPLKRQCQCHSQRLPWRTPGGRPSPVRRHVDEVLQLGVPPPAADQAQVRVWVPILACRGVRGRLLGGLLQQPLPHEGPHAHRPVVGPRHGVADARVDPPEGNVGRDVHVAQHLRGLAHERKELPGAAAAAGHLVHDAARAAAHLVLHQLAQPGQLQRGDGQPERSRHRRHGGNLQGRRGRAMAPWGAKIQSWRPSTSAENLDRRIAFADFDFYTHAFKISEIQTICKLLLHVTSPCPNSGPGATLKGRRVRLVSPAGAADLDCCGGGDALALGHGGVDEDGQAVAAAQALLAHQHQHGPGHVRRPPLAGVPLKQGARGGVREGLPGGKVQQVLQVQVERGRPVRLLRAKRHDAQRGLRVAPLGLLARDGVLPQNRSRCNPATRCQLLLLESLDSKSLVA